MIVFSRKRKIEALKRVYSEAHDSISGVLSECDLVKDADYETAVFLYYLMLQRFHQKAIIENLKTEIALLVSGSCKSNKQAETMKYRMRVYTEVSNGVYRPRGFWFMSEPGGKVFSSAKACAMIAFGDFLIFPECAENYYHYPVPVMDIFTLPQFVSTFTGEAWEMYEAYLRGIGLK